MDDYINRKAVAELRPKNIEIINSSAYIELDELLDLVEGIPAADVEPVRRWIPCSERMPDLKPCNAGTAYSEAVNVWTTGRKIMVGIWDGTDWIAPYYFWEAWDEQITHWMPLSVPPGKG